MSGVEISGGDLDPPLAVAWREIGEVLGRARLAMAHHRALDAAIRERAGMLRADQEISSDDALPWRAAGAAVWEACRPADAGEQLDLLAGLL